MNTVLLTFTQLLLLSSQLTLGQQGDGAAEASEPKAAAASAEEISRTSYFFGRSYGAQLRAIELEPNIGMMLKGIEDGAAGTQLPLSQDDYQTAFIAVMKSNQEKRIVGNATLLSENAKRPDVISKKSGLQIESLQLGVGDTPEQASRVRLRAIGRTRQGVELPPLSPQSAEHVGISEVGVNDLIPGLRELVLNMHLGDKCRAWIPSDLAYGEKGATIGQMSVLPHTVLIYDVELVKIIPAATNAKPKPVVRLRLSSSQIDDVIRDGLDAGEFTAEISNLGRLVPGMMATDIDGVTTKYVLLGSLPGSYMFDGANQQAEYRVRGVIELLRRYLPNGSLDRASVEKICNLAVERLPGEDGITKDALRVWWETLHDDFRKILETDGSRFGGFVEYGIIVWNPGDRKFPFEDPPVAAPVGLQIKLIGKPGIRVRILPSYQVRMLETDVKIKRDDWPWRNDIDFAANNEAVVNLMSGAIYKFFIEQNGKADVRTKSFHVQEKEYVLPVQ